MCLFEDCFCLRQNYNNCQFIITVYCIFVLATVFKHSAGHARIPTRILTCAPHKGASVLPGAFPCSFFGLHLLVRVVYTYVLSIWTNLNLWALTLLYSSLSVL